MKTLFISSTLFHYVLQFSRLLNKMDSNGTFPNFLQPTICLQNIHEDYWGQTLFKITKWRLFPYTLTGLYVFILQDVSFIAAPSTVALSHAKPASTRTSRDRCGAQNCDKWYAVHNWMCRYNQQALLYTNWCFACLRENWTNTENTRFIFHALRRPPSPSSSNSTTIFNVYFYLLCVLVFTVFCTVCTVFLYSFVYVYLSLFVTSVRTTATEWKLKCSK
jgi:hypothetical protein